MKKILVLILALVMIMSLTACGGGDDSTEIIVTNDDGYSCIKENKMGSIIEKVEITADNWQDYIKIVSFEEKIVSKDVFGDVTSEGSKTIHVLGVETEKIYAFDSTAAIKLKNKALSPPIRP